MPSNTAAWLNEPKAKTVEIKPAPYTSPGQNEIVIKNEAIAINPVDWIDKSLVFPWIKYPFVFGSDSAGEVVEVGPGVTDFEIGDRVLGHALGTAKKFNNPAMGAFQTYTILLAHMATRIPISLEYEDAAVLPLGLSTAACGLFQDDQLNLQLPTAQSHKLASKTLLIWGGSTSVGSNAIQLAVAAGYEVIATSSPRNFEYVKKLGASQVFDYNSKTVIKDIIRAFEGKTSAGAFSIGYGAADACLSILAKCKGQKFLTMATYPMPKQTPQRLVFLKTVYAYLSGMVSIWAKSKSRGIRTNFIFADTLVHNGVGKAIYVDFLPEALAQERYVVAPEPIVVGKGLEFVQAGLEMQKKGVSAKKVVVTL